METINEQSLEWREYDHGDATFRRKQLSSAVGADDIGCSLYELPAGKQSWPYHYHTANEEALYVLAGTGLLRCADGEESLTEGDYVTLPANEHGGHRVVNDSEEPLRYLMVSTMHEPDVTIYPEMNTFGVFVGSPPGGRGERAFHGYYDLDEDTDYWPE
ncbi:cupin [Natrialba chahannaoensis JCM 10990]|uniref:Cupin n=1 Tax=Natrialba chahannaoensis JCM 10990 TaxID=1227492 RepID=M0AGG9_9EURY|nr:cupin domain-containing protein [Natrialba chahannaoensis]ELY96977.1 cupin [Natrialba chahannaoensis JCM 10990]